MIRLRTVAPAFSVALVLLAAPSRAQTVAPVVPLRPASTPAAAIAPASTADAAPPPLSAEETAELKALYDALSPDEQADMRAAYAAMGYDPAALFDGGTAPGAGAAPAGPTLAAAVQALDFARTPPAVLAARSKLSLEPRELPAADAPPPVLAAWLHLRVMAGEWSELHVFLRERAGADAEAVYAHVLQSTNKGDPGLLPEEVLALADAAPAADGTIPGWQLDVLAQLLRGAATKTSTGPMLAQIRDGTRLFGPQDDASRRRTALLLVKSGLAVDAADFLPPLDAARADGDALVLLQHGQYHEGLATRGGDADAERLVAFGLYGEVTGREDADFALRQEALRLALALVPEVPETPGTAWLRDALASPTLGPATLEVIALDALTMRDRKVEEAKRVRAIVTMKRAVDALLDAEGVDLDALRVPLRMLTIGLVGEVETGLAQRADRRGVPPETGLLLRAVPDERWLAMLEPSLALRAYRAFIGVATVADETDLALRILAQGVRSHADQAPELAEHFLSLWTKRLRPQEETDQNAAIMAAIYAFGGRNAVPAAPLTRGRQRRNLDRLSRVIALLEDAGVDARTLPGTVNAFRACHSRAEVFTPADIEAVLGPIDGLPANTAWMLAETMRTGLNGDWRNRQMQNELGMRRSAAEIAAVVDEGYALATALVDRAVRLEPESWQFAMTRAALAYDRLDHAQAQQKQDFAAYNEYRRLAFKAFAAAADRYAAELAAGRARLSADVYLLWFNAAIGASELNYLSRDNIVTEGDRRDDQVDLVRRAIDALPPAEAQEHVAAFAEAMGARVNALSPEVKPRVVRHALRVIGDHPAGASLREMKQLHDDLVGEEIKLRLALDGPDRVGTTRSFGAMLSIRYTNAVDRETDGFAKYLQNEVWVMMGPRSTSVNYRDRLQRAIEDALEESFEIDALAFFEALQPSREVREAGSAGWQEKPLAYLVLRAKDPSIERLPSVRMDLDFIDASGPVILTVESNAPPLDAAEDAGLRPVRGLEVTQTVDLRNVRRDEKDHEVVLEVHAKGRGVVPTLDDLLDGLAEALPGYAIAPDGIETHPIDVLQADGMGDSALSMALAMRNEDELNARTYLEADEDGIYRLVTERSWTVVYRPTGAAVGEAFRLPALRDGVEATLVSKRYADMDIVLASGPTVAVDAPLLSPTTIGLGALVLLAVGAATLVLVRRAARAVDDAAGDDLRPHRFTPLAVVGALQRLAREHGERLDPARRAELATEISALERRWFGPEGSEPSESELRGVTERWLGR